MPQGLGWGAEPRPKGRKALSCLTQHDRLKLEERGQRTEPPIPAPPRAPGQRPRARRAASGKELGREAGREAGRGGGAAPALSRLLPRSPGSPPPPFPGVRRGRGAGSPVRLSQGRPGGRCRGGRRWRWRPCPRTGSSTASTTARRVSARGGRGGPGWRGEAGAASERGEARAEQTLLPPDRPAASPPGTGGRRRRRKKQWRKLSGVALPATPADPAPRPGRQPSAGPPAARPAGVGGRRDLLCSQHPLRSCRGFSGVGKWLFQPFILCPLGGVACGAPRAAGRARLPLPPSLFSHEPGLPWERWFLSSRSSLVAHEFLQWLPWLSREVTSRYVVSS